MNNPSVSIDRLIFIPLSILRVGQSLPYALYNTSGKFIAAKGYIFKNEIEISLVSHSRPMRLKTSAENRENSESERQKNDGASGSLERVDSSISYGGGVQLASQRREYDFNDYQTVEMSETGKKTNAVTIINQLINAFPKLCDTFHNDVSAVPNMLKNMETKLFSVIKQDRDAAIGLIHISEINSQAEHCIFSAILAAIYTQTIGYPDRFVRLVTTSALCMNLGAIKLHDELNSKDAGLCEDLLSEIKKHSEESVALMGKADIRHPTIINGIMHHHERPDGQGYPAGLHSSEIPDEALIIGIVDTYLAMIGPRAYRNKIQPKEALKRVLFEGHKYDNEFYTTFIKAIGVYPAGTFHELNSGEVVVVIRRNPKHATKPEVCILINSKGEQVSELKTFRLVNSNQTIKIPHPGGRGLHVHPEVLWN